MWTFENVTSTMFNNWKLSAEEYLRDYFNSNQNTLIFETDNDNAGNNNITIGYEEYINKVEISL